MSRKSAPSSYRVSMEDVVQVVAEHAAEWQCTAYFVITLGKPVGPAAYVDVTLREGLYEAAGKELYRVRYPLDSKHAERWPGNMLHACMTVYDWIQQHPWLWPESKRREARGEG